MVNAFKEKSSLIQGDVVELLKKEERDFQLIISSPPYNINKEYETKKPLQDYLTWQAEVASLLVPRLKLGGSLCWQVGNYVNNGAITPLDIPFYNIFAELGLTLRNRIIWHFGHGLHARKRFSGRYETILWFTKGDEYTFNLDPVRVPSKYPNKKHFKGPKKGQLSGNPKGKNPSDVWKKLQSDWDSAFWEIPNVKSNHPEKTGHPCQFPVELIERCILALTDEGDFVFDPFMGVGSTAIAAIKNHRSVVGYDLSQEYLGLAENRLDLLRRGKIKLRPMTKPIHQPNKSSSTQKEKLFQK